MYTEVSRLRQPYRKAETGLRVRFSSATFTGTDWFTGVTANNTATTILL